MRLRGSHDYIAHVDLEQTATQRWSARGGCCSFLCACCRCLSSPLRSRSAARRSVQVSRLRPLRVFAARPRSRVKHRLAKRSGKSKRGRFFPHAQYIGGFLWELWEQGPWQVPGLGHAAASTTSFQGSPGWAAIVSKPGSPLAVRHGAVLDAPCERKSKTK